MNYIKLETGRKRQEYEFIDFPNAYFRSCCEQNDVEVHLVGSLKLDDSPYILILCNVPIEKSEAFEKAMQDLERKMLICGHNDYPEFCKSYFDEIDRLNNPKCPECGSDNLATIFYEYPYLPLFFKRKFKKDIKNKKVIIYEGKKLSDEESERWHCNECGCEF